MKVTQVQFSEELAAVCGITASDGKRFLAIFKSLVYEKLAAGHSIELSGFGQFYVTNRKPKLGVNPRTLVHITIPARNVPSFRAGEAMRKAVNN